MWKVIDHQVGQCVLYTHGCLDAGGGWISCSDRVSYGHVQVHGHVHLATVQLYIHMWMCFLSLDGSLTVADLMSYRCLYTCVCSTIAHTHITGVQICLGLNEREC